MGATYQRGDALMLLLIFAATFFSYVIDHPLARLPLTGIGIYLLFKYPIRSWWK